MALKIPISGVEGRYHLRPDRLLATSSQIPERVRLGRGLGCGEGRAAPHSWLPRHTAEAEWEGRVPAHARHTP